jgi:hypothetical protein
MGTTRQESCESLFWIGENQWSTLKGPKKSQHNPKLVCVLWYGISTLKSLAAAAFTKRNANK